jgi:hypothetical protein
MYYAVALPVSLYVCSTWVTINTQTRRPAKIPEGVKQRFVRLAPSPPRFAIAADQARKKLPEFEWPAKVGAQRKTEWGRYDVELLATQRQFRKDLV